MVSRLANLGIFTIYKTIMWHKTFTIVVKCLTNPNSVATESITASSSAYLLP